MQPTIIKEIITLVLLIMFITMFYWALPPMLYIACYLFVVAMFVVFVFSLLAKTDRDEREEAHKSIAAEAGFITGSLLLLVGIAHQTFVMQHADPWLFGILVAMLLVRLGVRLYLDRVN